MCGISAIISRESSYVYPFLVNSLKNLQNRGYDSAGICAVNNKNEFELFKKASTNEKTAIELIEEVGDTLFNKCSIGIAHTRWATHGSKTDINSHPHVCYQNKIAIVHNGIVENYDIIKAFLVSKGVEFKSDCDSEAIANLISFYHNDNSIIESMNKACKDLQGTWAIALISKEDNALYFTRHGSPLLLCKTKDHVVVTSEVCGLYTANETFTTYVPVKEGIIYKMDLDTKLHMPKRNVSFINMETSPHPYKHWTLKEIFYQANSVQTAINYGGRFIENSGIKLGGLEGYEDKLLDCDNVILLGCGTSYHSCLVGYEFFDNFRIFQSVKCMDASEFDENTIRPDDKNTLVIMVSQSGETKDLHKCLAICKKNEKVMTLGIVNVVDSMIARETHCGVYLNAGREVGVASTKSFTSQVIALVLISLWYHQHKHPFKKDIREYYIDNLKEFTTTTHKILAYLDEFDFETLVENMVQKSMFILGTKGKEFAIALEGSLKVKEISYIHCEGYFTSSLKHGPLALIEKDTPVIHLISNKNQYEMISNSMAQVTSRHGNAVLIGNHPNATIPIETDNEFGFLWNNIALQLLAYYLSVKQNINPDMPRNLAKVVTVQ
jgi:glucosamine--fructose-6-phosphate aminotransferase (isomerizing)